MTSLLEWLASACIVLGATVILLGAMGIVRFPDIFSRFSAASTSGTVGTVILLLGACLADPRPGVWARALVIIVALGGSIPLSGQAMGRFAYRGGAFITPLTHRDDIASRKALNRAKATSAKQHKN